MKKNLIWIFIFMTGLSFFATSIAQAAYQELEPFPLECYCKKPPEPHDPADPQYYFACPVREPIGGNNPGGTGGPKPCINLE